MNTPFNLNTEQLFYLNLILLCGCAVILTVLILRKTGKMRCLVLYPDLTYKIEFYKREDKLGEAKVTYGKKKEQENINYKPNNIFQERKPGVKFWRLPHRMLIVNKATLKTVGFTTKIEEGNPETTIKTEIGELQYYWTRKEIKDWVNKKIAEAKAKAKLFSRAELFLILALLAINFFVVIMIAREVGAL